MCYRLQNIEQQEAVSRQPDARRSGRVCGPVCSTDSWYGRFSVTVPVGHGHVCYQAGGCSGGHPRTTQGIVVAWWFAVRVTVRPLRFPAAGCRRVQYSISVPTATAVQHSVAYRWLLFRAVSGRQLDHGHLGWWRRWRWRATTVQTVFVVVIRPPWPLSRRP